MRVSEDRARWREVGEAYVQQWTVVVDDDDDDCIGIDCDRRFRNPID
jgi:hypothetical protein